MADISALSNELIKVSLPAPYVALVELSRKPVNAFSEKFWTNFGNVFDDLSKRGDVRAIVLASALPKFFSAGIDLNALGNLPNNETEPARRALQNKANIEAFQRSIGAVERCPYPVVVALHGLAFGLAIDIATACDVRYAAADATFSIKEVDVGLAADIGTLARLPKVVGNESLVRELAFTARNFSAAEAEKLGLVSKVVEGSRDEVLKAALDTATLIASKSPIATLGTKHLLLHARDHTVQENLDYTATWNGAMIQTGDLQEGMKAFQQKRKPTFAPLKTPTAKL